MCIHDNHILPILIYILPWVAWKERHNSYIYYIYVCVEISYDSSEHISDMYNLQIPSLQHHVCNIWEPYCWRNDFIVSFRNGAWCIKYFASVGNYSSFYNNWGSSGDCQDYSIVQVSQTVNYSNAIIRNRKRGPKKQQ